MMQSTDSTLIFGFLVAFLGLFAVGVSAGMVWPATQRRLVAMGMTWLEDDPGGGERRREGEDNNVPKLWDVWVRPMAASTSQGEKGGDERLGGDSAGEAKGKRATGSAEACGAWPHACAWERLRASTIPSCPLRARMITSFCSCA